CHPLRDPPGRRRNSPAPSCVGLPRPTPSPLNSASQPARPGPPPPYTSAPLAEEPPLSFKLILTRTSSGDSPTVHYDRERKDEEDAGSPLPIGIQLQNQTSRRVRELD